MIAIREIQEVKSGPVTIDLPNNWHVKKVKIIILPLEEKSHDDQTLSELLLEGPTLTDDELQEYDTVREWMNQSEAQSWWWNPSQNRRSAIPRHTEVKDILAKKICKDLGVKSIK